MNNNEFAAWPLVHHMIYSLVWLAIWCSNICSCPPPSYFLVIGMDTPPEHRNTLMLSWELKGCRRKIGERVFCDCLGSPAVRKLGPIRLCACASMSTGIYRITISMWECRRPLWLIRMFQSMCFLLYKQLDVNVWVMSSVSSFDLRCFRLIIEW